MGGSSRTETHNRVHNFSHHTCPVQGALTWQAELYSDQSEWFQVKLFWPIRPLLFSSTRPLTRQWKAIVKGTVSRDFRLSFFSLNFTPGSPDSWAKTVLHIYSNSRRYSIKFDDKNRNSPLCGIARSCDSPLCGIAWSRLPAVPHSTESTRNFWLEFHIEWHSA
jgi:hypothetical protein